MSETLVVTYRLKDGADLDAFARWSAEVDGPRCRQFDACLSFDTFVVPTAAADEAQVVEVIGVTSAEAWNEAVAGPGHADVMEAWNAFGDDSTVRVLTARPV